MAYDKIVDSSFLDGGLTRIADAIREKNGSSEALLFPDDFVVAIQAIEGGGGETEEQYVYYYNKGDENTALTGGWSGINIRSDEGWVNGTLTKGASSMTITVNNSSYGVGTAKQVDLTNVQTLYINASAPGFTGGEYDQATVWISLLRGTGTDTSYVKTLELESGLNTLDISDVTGSHYIVIDAASDYNRALVINSVYGLNVSAGIEEGSTSEILFSADDKNVPVTGGWTSTGYSYATAHGIRASVGTTITCSAICGDTDYDGIVGTTQTVEPGVYRRIRVKGSLDKYESTSTFLVGVAAAKKITLTPLAHTNITAAGSFDVSVDVSGLTTAGYVFVAALRSAVDYDEYTCVLTVTEIIGEFKDELVLLYDVGSYAKETGGIKGNAQAQSSSFRGLAPSITEKADSFSATVQYSSQNTSGTVTFINAIDLSNVKTVYAEIEAYLGKPALWIGSSQTTNLNSCTKGSSTLTATGWKKIDVSSYTGNLFVGFSLAVSTSGQTYTVTVRRIGYMEK